MEEGGAEGAEWGGQAPQAPRLRPPALTEELGRGEERCCSGLKAEFFWGGGHM